MEPEAENNQNEGRNEPYYSNNNSAVKWAVGNISTQNRNMIGKSINK